MAPTLLRRLGCRVAAVTLALVGVTPASGQSGDDSRLKAAIVSKFPEFVHWPPGALADQQEMVLCVTHRGSFAEHLRAVVTGVRVQGHPMLVRELVGPAGVSGCHVLVVAADSHLDNDELLAAVANLPVLTIGDDPALLERGAILALRPMGGRLRFDADLDAADRAGLRLRSQLLRLAVNVRGAR